MTDREPVMILLSPKDRLRLLALLAGAGPVPLIYGEARSPALREQKGFRRFTLSSTVR